MCGIAGLVASAATVPVQACLAAMAGAIVHRGPDDHGYFQAVSDNGRHDIGLAHRRLSIIDLSTGHQPLGNEDGTVNIVFNGEIYNFEAVRQELVSLGHSFRTRSDTEVIVHAFEQWGPACLERLRGMFAFAIWDSRRQRLFLARDRFGKKPLFLCQRGDSLFFASQIKALLAAPGVRAEPDLASIRRYFQYRYVPGPATMFAGIRKLMPGSYALWEKGQFTEHSYYQAPDRVARQRRDRPTDIVGAFLEGLDEAVRIRMISDVPFGAFLSGGIDSSAVVALMARHSGMRVKTFSVGFTEAAFSELAYAGAVASHLGTDHHELCVSQSHLMEHLPALVRFRDAPVAEPSDIPIYLLSLEARRSVKMVLTGEGADEMLGGYPKHSVERFVSSYQAIPRSLRSAVVEPLVKRLPFRHQRLKTAVAALGIEDRTERMARWFGALTPVEMDELLALDQDAGATAGCDAPFEVDPANTALRSILYFDQTSWLPDNLLERGDRMTMAASLEARMPFMDHELGEFVSGLPDHWRIRGRTTKYVLRRAMQRLLPPQILERPKVGFKVPVSEWFRGPMRGYLEDHLVGGNSRTRDYYRPAQLRRVLDDHMDGRQNHEKLLWTMLSLEVWHRCYL